MNYLLYISIVTVLFIIYVEYSVGGILWRQTSSGVKSFNFGSLFNYLIKLITISIVKILILKISINLYLYRNIMKNVKKILVK